MVSKGSVVPKVIVVVAPVSHHRILSVVFSVVAVVLHIVVV